MATKSSERLPFEPGKNRKKEKKTPNTVTPVTKVENKPSSIKTKQEKVPIPQAVSQRMVRRMATFCGLPTAVGMLTFVASYVIVKNELLPLPHTFVVFGSMACFVVGFLGLSYGFLSASWDEEIPGSALGWEEFTTNFSRVRSAWRSEQPKS